MQAPGSVTRGGSCLRWRLPALTVGPTPRPLRADRDGRPGAEVACRSAGGHGEYMHDVARDHPVVDVGQLQIPDGLAGLQRDRRVVDAHLLVLAPALDVQVWQGGQDVAARSCRVRPPVGKTE